MWPRQGSLNSPPSRTRKLSWAPPSPPSPSPILHPQHILFPPPPLQSFAGCVWRSRSDDITTVARATGTDKSG